MKIDFLNILEKAIRNVDTSYQSVDVAHLSPEDDVNIKRERVYCYELYHQLRLIIGESFYDVNGEIDKRGHKLISDGFNPDFIIHKQGSMNFNELALEVKVNWVKENVKKDFCTLYKMTECYGYKLGVFLFVGKRFSEIKSDLFLLKNDIYNNDTSINNKMYIMCVKGCDLETYTLKSVWEKYDKDQP